MISQGNLKRAYGINVSTHCGKMETINSISTSPSLNPICQARAKAKGSVCAVCYAQQYEAFRRNLRLSLERNTNALTSAIIPLEDMPMLGSESGCFRIESFGDIQNVVQVVNYWRMIEANPRTKFGWWTKNPDIIARAIKEFDLVKPDNLQIVQSSLHLNRQDSPAYDFVDIVFTVYDKEYVEEHCIPIHCGGKSCMECGYKCYLGTHDVVYVNEIKK